MGLELVDRLGGEIERRWVALNYDPRSFPDVATQALLEAALPAQLDRDQIIDWVLEAQTLPRQENLPATFGQPPVTLFRSRRFYIEALFWIDGSTAIHEHAFSGAFQVLEGSSIETRFSFEPRQTFDGQFALGALEVAATCLLGKGDVRPISSGMGRLVHSLFHLERPSTTIVVRTFRDAEAGPQLRYLRPGIGHNPFFEEETLTRTLEIVALMRQISHPAFEEKVGNVIARLDLHSAFRVLVACSLLPDRSLFERLLERVRDGAIREVFRFAFEEERRLKFLLSRRALVMDTDLRFFLGVLLNTYRRAHVLSLVKSRVPERDAASQVAGWVRRLSEVKLSLQAGKRPWQASVLGLPEMDDAAERALAEILSASDDEAGRAASPLLATLRAIPSLAALFG